MTQIEPTDFRQSKYQPTLIRERSYNQKRLCNMITGINMYSLEESFLSFLYDKLSRSSDCNGETEGF